MEYITWFSLEPDIIKINGLVSNNVKYVDDTIIIIRTAATNETTLQMVHKYKNLGREVNYQVDNSKNPKKNKNHQIYKHEHTFLPKIEHCNNAENTEM